MAATIPPALSGADYLESPALGDRPEVSPNVE